MTQDWAAWGSAWLKRGHLYTESQMDAQQSQHDTCGLIWNENPEKLPLSLKIWTKNTQEGYRLWIQDKKQYRCRVWQTKSMFIKHPCAHLHASVSLTTELQPRDQFQSLAYKNWPTKWFHFWPVQLTEVAPFLSFCLLLWSHAEDSTICEQSKTSNHTLGEFCSRKWTNYTTLCKSGKLLLHYTFDIWELFIIQHKLFY